MQTLGKLSWEDYRYVLAISRAGGVTGAVESLDVNVSTAFRRLDKIEHSIQTLVFDRSRKGYLPTVAGKEIVRAAEIMEQASFSADRIVTGHDQLLVGDLNITSTESMAVCFVTRHLQSFREKHPGLTVNIISENRVLNLAEREADIAIRPRRPTDETMIGRKIAQSKWGFYGNATFSDRLGLIENPDTLSKEPFIVWSGNPLAKETEHWLRKEIPDLNVVCKSSSLISNAQMASLGTGMTMLPCMVGETWPDLNLICSPLQSEEEDPGEFWLVIHEDMRHNARVRALLEHMAVCAKNDLALFEPT
ncbi:MAG: LysR family transcriptional regulator [Rhodospirillales bacterium]|jgi:DNA-binding transcriptional LysR family regulator|nr:LysR family transcriptional regulator [Rhodospirillales bacterium]